MNKMAKKQEQPVQGKQEKLKRASGDVYLAIIDDTQESLLAIRYAVRRAKATGGHVAMAYMIRRHDFQPWGNVDSKMRQERRAEAEALVQGVAEQVYELSGLAPSIYLEESDDLHHDIVAGILERDEDIKVLVLGAHSGSGGPGPLVSYFSGKGLSKLPVLLAIIPSHLCESDIDSLSLGT